MALPSSVATLTNTAPASSEPRLRTEPNTPSVWQRRRYAATQMLLFRRAICTEVFGAGNFSEHFGPGRNWNPAIADDLIRVHRDSRARQDSFRPAPRSVNSCSPRLVSLNSLP